MKQTITNWLTAIAIVVVIVLAVPHLASAHVPTVTADCRVLEVTLTDYEPESAVTVTVDGSSSTYKFDGSFHKAVPWSPEKPHTWLVRVDNRGDGKSDEWDRLWTGTSTSCVPTAKQCSDNFQSGLPRCTPIVAPTTIPDLMNPPVIERFNPATPPCVLDGRYDANSPQCTALDTQVADRAVTPPAQPEVALAFTGVNLYQKFILAALFLGAGVWMTKTASGIRKEANQLP